jgi:hypothetical protein
VRATFTVFDPGARIGVVARRAAVDEARVGYAFNLAVDRGSAWVSAVFESDACVEQKSLRATTAAAGRGLRRVHMVELRAEGGRLQAFVDGQRVLTVDDATFAQGAFGVRIGRETPRDLTPVRVLCHGYDLREVLT